MEKSCYDDWLHIIDKIIFIYNVKYLLNETKLNKKGVNLNEFRTD